jgi:hypothetical protein
VAASTELQTADGIVVESPNGWEVRPDGPQKLGNEAADLRLIAASPRLLAALQVVVNDWTQQFERNGHHAPSWCKQARAAIAEATGQ